jgi:hypothetical protein
LERSGHSNGTSEADQEKKAYLRWELIGLGMALEKGFQHGKSSNTEKISNKEDHQHGKSATTFPTGAGRGTQISLNAYIDRAGPLSSTWITFGLRRIINKPSGSIP